jgi:probable addiction module antidote protein
MRKTRSQIAVKSTTVRKPAVSTGDYAQEVIDALKDPAEAAAYLEAALEEADQEGLLMAIRRVAEAHGGIAAIAANTGLSRETLYRTLSKRGNPTIATLSNVLAATGLRLSIRPV